MNKEQSGQIDAGQPDDQSRQRPNGEVGEPIRSGGRGGGRWIGERFVSAEEIVEQVRSLLAENIPPGDIKRLMVKKFGGSGRSFEKHIAVARKRNLACISRSKPEAKADSVQQWRMMLTEQRQRKAKAEQEFERERIKLEQLRLAFDQAGVEQFDLAFQRLDQQTAVVDRVERRLTAAMAAIERHQHTIDNILGNRSPLQIENVIDQDRKNELAHRDCFHVGPGIGVQCEPKDQAQENALVAFLNAILLRDAGWCRRLHGRAEAELQRAIDNDCDSIEDTDRIEIDELIPELVAA